MALKVEGTLEELRALFLGAAISEAKSTAKKAGKKVVKKAVKKVLTEWQKFLKSFKYRKQRRNESNSAYFAARTKAASRAYKKRKPKPSKLPGQPRRR